MEKKIIKQNAIIAEFMDYITPSQDSADWTKRRVEANWHTDFKYHSSWDWLMPCVEKIESLGYYVEINKWSSVYCEQKKDFREAISIVHSLPNKLSNTYKVVVEFIEWYNLKRKE